MSTSDRTELLTEIVEAKVAIYEGEYKIKWHTRALYCLLVGITTVVAIYAIIDPLSSSAFKSVFDNLGGFAVAFTLLSGIVVIFPYLRDIFGDDQEHMIGPRKVIREAKTAVAELEYKLDLIDELKLGGISPQEHRIHRIPNLITSYRKQADRYRIWFIITQIIIILLSAAITSLSGGWLDKYIPIPWIVPVFSALISILTSVTLFFKFREKGSNLQQTADAMDLEYQACELGIKDYKGMSEKDAHILLVERVEEMRKEQQQRQQQLEQSSQTEQNALQTGN